jgi:acetate---CoA ligase (ADP-forming)
VTDPSAIASAIVAGAAHAEGKPVVTTFMRAAGAPPELAPIPCYRFPEAGALALAKATAYAQWRSRPEGAPTSLPELDKVKVRAVLEGALQRGAGWLTVQEVQTLFATCRLPVAPAAIVASEDEAMRAADAIGFPVALKAVGPTLLHKSDVGGVRLDLRDRREMGEAWRDLKARLGEQLTGALVQGMVPAGVELLVGTIEDETFGPVLLCSLGGTLVELLGKPMARLLPLMDTDLDELLRDMPGNALLRGYRGSPPVDEPALRDLLVRVSWLASTFPEILEMDLNPVRLFQSGLSVVDARIRVGHVARRAPSRRIAY